MAFSEATSLLSSGASATRNTSSDSSLTCRVTTRTFRIWRRRSEDYHYYYYRQSRPRKVIEKCESQLSQIGKNLGVEKILSEVITTVPLQLYGLIS